MNKNFKSYALYWGILLVLFNACAFLTRSQWGLIEGSEAAFWIGYGFITAAFIGHLIAGYVALRGDNATRTFYNLSLMRISTTGLIVSFIIGILTMVRPYLDSWIDYANIAITILTTILVKAKLPTIIVAALVDIATVFLAPRMRVWTGVVSCLIVLAVTAMRCAGAAMAARAVSDVDEKMRQQTFFIKNLSAEAQTMLDSEKDPEIRKQLEKVYEAIRYSSPKTAPGLYDIEIQMSRMLNELKAAVGSGDRDAVGEISGAILSLANERNQKAKLYR